MRLREPYDDELTYRFKPCYLSASYELMRSERVFRGTKANGQTRSDNTEVGDSSNTASLHGSQQIRHFNGGESGFVPLVSRFSTGSIQCLIHRLTR